MGNKHWRWEVSVKDELEVVVMGRAEEESEKPQEQQNLNPPARAQTRVSPNSSTSNPDLCKSPWGPGGPSSCLGVLMNRCSGRPLLCWWALAFPHLLIVHSSMVLSPTEWKSVFKSFADGICPRSAPWSSEEQFHSLFSLKSFLVSSLLFFRINNVLSVFDCSLSSRLWLLDLNSSLCVWSDQYFYLPSVGHVIQLGLL